MNATATESHIARVRVVEKSDENIVVSITGTNYQLHLKPTTAVDTPVGKRTKGVIRTDVWKVDFVSAGGGAYVEPVYGRPRRVQGRVIGTGPGANSVVVDVCGCPFIGDLPERWQAADMKPGIRVGLEVHQGATFEPV
jgi:hypothetical protein